MEPFFFFASSFFFLRFLLRRAPLDSLLEELLREGDLRRRRPRDRERDRERDRFFLSLELFLSSEPFFLSSEELFLSFFLSLDGERERDGLLEREDDELRDDDDELRDRRRPRLREGDGVGKSRFKVF